MYFYYTNVVPEVFKGAKECPTDKIPYLDEFIAAKACTTSTRLGRACKLNCKFDKTKRTKTIPKFFTAKCVKATDDSGNVIGAKFQYSKTFEEISKLCGKGCGMKSITDTMGTSATSTNCNVENDFIKFGGPKKCKMQCKHSVSKFYGDA